MDVLCQRDLAENIITVAFVSCAYTYIVDAAATPVVDIVDADDDDVNTKYNIIQCLAYDARRRCIVWEYYHKIYANILAWEMRDDMCDGRRNTAMSSPFGCRLIAGGQS